MPTLARRRYPDSIRTTLLEASASRRRQLSSLPPGGDLVAVAHRRSIERILGDIEHAVARLEDGTYGDCLRCGEQVALDDLVELPWTTRCEPCAAL